MSEKLIDLLTKATGDISAALTMGGFNSIIAKWTAPYVEAINHFDDHPITSNPVDVSGGAVDERQAVAWMYTRHATAEPSNIRFATTRWFSGHAGWTETPLYAHPPEIEALREAIEALGAMPEGYCFCSSDRVGDDSKKHEPECRDLRAALKGNQP